MNRYGQCGIDYENTDVVAEPRPVDTPVEFGECLSISCGPLSYNPQPCLSGVLCVDVLVHPQGKLTHFHVYLCALRFASLLCSLKHVSRVGDHTRLQLVWMAVCTAGDHIMTANSAWAI
jgi:hypothetical protein